MKYLRIVSKNVPNNFYCRRCKKSTTSIIKVIDESFCDSCVPEKYKNKLVNVNQNRELV